MSNLRIYIAVILCLIAPFLLYAQKAKIITGFVRDAETSETLVGVLIKADDGRSIVTNSYGYFAFSVGEGDAGLEFSHLGYITQRREIPTTENVLDIRMSLANYTLMEVTVTANEQHVAQMQTLGRASLNSSLLKIVPTFLGEQDVLKYFQLLPGVNPGKEGTSGLNVRGGSHDQTLILIDDVPVYNSGHAFGFVSVFSGSYIKSADLYKGYIPESFGGRLSGVATMQMREGNRQQHHQTLQFGTLTSSLLFEGPLKKEKGSYLIGGRYFIPSLLLNIFERTQKHRSITIPDMGFYDLTAKLSYDIGKHSTLYGSFYMGHDNLGYTSYDSESQDETSEKVNMKGDTGLSWGNKIGSLRLSSRLSPNIFLKSTAYYSQLDNEKQTIYSTNQGYYQKGVTHSSLKEFGLKTQAEHKVTSTHKLNYGVNATHQLFSPQQIRMVQNGNETQESFGNPKLTNFSAFAGDEWRKGNWQTNIGLRYSYYTQGSEGYNSVEPRLSATYFMPGSAIWVSYVRNTQPLFSMSQLFLSLPLDYWIPYQDAKMMPESRQVSFGARHNFNNGLMVQAECYYKDIDNLTTVYNGNDFLNKQGGAYVGTGLAYGGEVMAQYSYKRFQSMVSYTYSKSVHKVDGKEYDFMYDTPHQLNLFMAIDTYKKPGILHTLSTNVCFRSGMPYFISKESYPTMPGIPSWDDNVINYPLFENDRLPDYFRLDLNYAMEKKKKNGKRIWQFSLLNTTAHKNPYLIYNNSDYGKFEAFQIIPIFPSFSYTRVF